MTDLRKAAKMAIKCYAARENIKLSKAMQTLELALAQSPCQTGSQCIGGKCPECEWVGLDKSDMNVLRSVAEFTSDAEGFIRLVEEKLKGKNT